MKTLLAFIVALFFAVPVMASDVPAWSITHGEGSMIGFEGVQMGAPFEGHFREFDGTILFNPDNLGGSKADITIILSSADASSPDRNKYLSMPDWFHTANFPTARFVTTAIEKGLDTNQYVARGNLTIRDVTLPVTLPFTLTITGNQAVMAGETSINRIDYGVGQGQWADTKTVGADVKIKIKLTATKP